MQVKTNGIVLHSIKYSDSATIVTMYTRQFGRVSYMVNAVNKKKSVYRASFLQPLSILELDVFHVIGKDIQRIKDVRNQYSFIGIPYDPTKNAVALFISEILFRILRQTEPDETVFLFLENSIQQLDCIETGISNFHLVFLVKLTRYLGFEPNEDEVNGTYFDLMNGIFLNTKPMHVHFLSQEVSVDFAAILHSDYNDMHLLDFSRVNRLKLIDGLVEYYRLHVPDFHVLNSLAVLKSLFD